MKRIIAMLLVLTLACLCLASCGENLRESIKEHRDEYDYQPDVIEDITLDVYIVCDDYRETGDDANKGIYDAVKRQIEIYTASAYHTTVVLHYVPSAQYEQTVKNNLDTADLVLITSKSLMDELVEDDKVADLTDFFSSNTYGSLNVTIAEALLEASKYEGKFYAVPNNRVLGSYTYALMNKNSLHSELKYPLASLSNFPYALSLDTVKDEAMVAALVRSLLAKSIVEGTGKDSVALTALQEALFEELVVDVFDATYAQKSTPEETIDVVNQLIAKLTEADLLTVEAGLAGMGIEAKLADILKKQTGLKIDSDEYLTYETNVQMALQESVAVYKANYLNYGFEEGDRPYPALHTLIGRYVADKSAEECTLLLDGDLFSMSEVEELIDYKTSYAAYADAVASAFDATAALESKDVVVVTDAAYEDKAAYEAAGWVCNVLATPTVNEEEAFTSAYAVIKQEGIDPARVMEIIYAFHTDAKLHNLLRFGIENVNYILDENTVNRVEKSLYLVNPLYVGNMLVPYYSEEFTAEDAANGQLQNKDATFVTIVVPEPEPEPAPAV